MTRDETNGEEETDDGIRDWRGAYQEGETG
jgi:hypothetical protein